MHYRNQYLDAIHWKFAHLHHFHVEAGLNLVHIRFLREGTNGMIRHSTQAVRQA